MRNLIIPAAAVAALALAPTPSQAQVVIQSGYTQPYYQPYYGGYAQPYYAPAPIGSGGLIQAAESYLLNQAGLGGYVAPYTAGYGNFSTFGQPYYGSGYRTYTPYYGGNTYYRTYRGNGWGNGRRR